MSVAVPQKRPDASAASRGSKLAWKRLGTNGVLALAWLLFAIANLAQWHRTGRPVGFGTMVVELIVVVLFLIRREAWITTRSPVAWVATVIATFGALGARPAYAPVLGLGTVYLTLQLVGAACAGLTLLFLGRSFGLVAANRGVRTAGPYGIVRHPLYASYFLTYAGYTLENPSLWNASLILTMFVFQLVRIRTEEDCLRGDPLYVRYCERVRYRLIPGVW